ncbi:hypothetical protein STAQ_01930 [Allostella sp. ATCC 35155]|nr:hypothetical protein STAQ_01930 [Stella sp. ATCC 35155]
MREFLEEISVPSSVEFDISISATYSFPNNPETVKSVSVSKYQMSGTEIVPRYRNPDGTYYGTTSLIEEIESDDAGSEWKAHEIFKSRGVGNPIHLSTEMDS